MAVAKLICGNCSSVISATDAFCPSCGAKIEHSAAPPAVRICSVCGHKNGSGGAYCEACGARLAG
ncbi:MAG: zinc ribbon domain-containing protein, partial [Bacteroidota bacterium]